MGHAGNFLIEGTHRHIIECRSEQKQTSNYLSCSLWEAQHPTTNGDDSCDFFFSQGLHHSKETHSYGSQQMHISFSWTENKQYVFVQVYFPLSTLLLFFLTKYQICNFERQNKRLKGGCHRLIYGERTVSSETSGMFVMW